MVARCTGCRCKVAPLARTPSSPRGCPSARPQAVKAGAGAASSGQASVGGPDGGERCRQATTELDAGGSREHEGVFSHETALSLHSLSDVLPARIHLTLPMAWAKRRFRVPEGVVLHHADIIARERTWIGSVPATSPRQTLIDVRRAKVSPEIVEQAIRQATTRGLIGKKDVARLESGRTS